MNLDIACEMKVRRANRLKLFSLSFFAYFFCFFSPDSLVAVSRTSTVLCQKCLSSIASHMKPFRLFTLSPIFVFVGSKCTKLKRKLNEMQTEKTKDALARQPACRNAHSDEHNFPFCERRRRFCHQQTAKRMNASIEWRRRDRIVYSFDFWLIRCHSSRNCFQCLCAKTKISMKMNSSEPTSCGARTRSAIRSHERKTIPKSSPNAQFLCDFHTHIVCIVVDSLG